MQLAELSRASEVSAASIKFYLRSGLLQPGARLNPTRAAYGPEHLQRLRLIQGLRQVVGLGLREITIIVDALDEADGSAEQTLELLGVIQSTVLKLQGPEVHTVEGDAVVTELGWPDEPSEARNALNAHLTAMTTAGVSLDPGTLRAYAAAADAIAGLDLGITGSKPTLDELALTAAVGMHMHSQLVLKMLALAQASHAIRRYGGRNLPRGTEE